MLLERYYIIKNLEKLLMNIEGDIFYLWNITIKEKNCSFERNKELNEKLKGNGATDSSFIAQIAIDAGK